MPKATQGICGRDTLGTAPALFPGRSKGQGMDGCDAQRAKGLLIIVGLP